MTERTRILLVMHRGGRGGTEYHVLWLGLGLVRKGWSVSLAVSKDGPMLASFRDGGIDVHFVRRRTAWDGAFLWRLSALIRKLRPDVVHAHSGRLPALAGRLSRAPLIVETRHGLGWMGDPPSIRRLRREARTCRLAHRTLTVCASDRAQLVAGGLPPSRVLHVPNGVPSPAVPVRSGQGDCVRLGYLGRLSAEKDPLFLSELVAPLNRVFPGGWMIAIAGEGPMRAALQEALARSGSADRACWLGEIDGPGRLLEQVDFLCVPSRTEGQPLSVLEAMALGVVPVARRIPSLEELLGGDPAAGLLPPAEPNAWVEAIHDIWSAPGRLDDLRREGRRRVVSDHGIDTMVDRIEEIYLRGLMANRTG